MLNYADQKGKGRGKAEKGKTKTEISSVTSPASISLFYHKDVHIVSSSQSHPHCPSNERKPSRPAVSPQRLGRGRRRGDHVEDGILGGDCVDLGEAELRRVEAVCLVDDGDARVAWLGEDDVDALERKILVSF